MFFVGLVWFCCTYLSLFWVKTNDDAIKKRWDERSVALLRDSTKTLIVRGSILSGEQKMFDPHDELTTNCD